MAMLMKRATRNIPLSGLGLDLSFPGFDSTTQAPVDPTAVDPWAVPVDTSNWPSGYGTTPGTTATGSGVTQSIISAIMAGEKNIAAPILTSLFGGPQPGQYISYNAKTGQSTAYALPSSSTTTNVSTFPGVSLTSSGLSSWLPILAIAGIGVFALKAIFGGKH